VPYPDNPERDSRSKPRRSYLDRLPNPWKWLGKLKRRLRASRQDRGSPRQRAKTYEKVAGQGRPERRKCTNCTVHMGFFSSWKNTRPLILPHLSHLNELYPSYSLHLVGHSLGGAVAALAGLETSALGYNPIVTTFGEPRIGNIGLREYLDAVFGLDGDESVAPGNEKGVSRYRRVTHVNDPVPLLPLAEWGYRMHAGEIYISKAALSPTVTDLRLCDGDEDARCIYGSEATDLSSEQLTVQKLTPQEFSEWSAELLSSEGREAAVSLEKRWGLPARYRMWQLFFAHRDYFWRIGLCVPGGDPVDWGRKYENIADGHGDSEDHDATNDEL
jgi:Lipase (class 3)